MASVTFITPDDARHGFGLAGFSQRVCRPEDAQRVIDEQTGTHREDILAIDERLLGGLEEGVLKRLEQTWPGIVVIIPAPEAIATAEDYALELIRRAIGYHVRLTP